MKRFLAVLLCLVMVLGSAGCDNSGSGNGSGTTPEGSATTYREMYAQEVTTMNYLYTGNTNDLSVCANVVDCLVEYDPYGVMIPSLAESWESNADQTVWTFKIRQGVKWVDHNGTEVADVTANDWVAAAHWINDANNMSGNQYLQGDFVKNAKAYYDQTAGQLAVDAGEFADLAAYYAANEKEAPATVLEPSDIGVRAVDEYTLEYTLNGSYSYFPTLLSFASYMPVYGPFMEECGASFGVDNETMLYNGAYILSSFQPQNHRTLTKNATYWDAENIKLESLEFTYNAQAATLAPEAFLRGETDFAEITADVLDQWLTDTEKSALVRGGRIDTSYSYFICLNFEARFDAAYEPDNWTLAVNNENFRQSLRFAFDKVGTKSVAEPYNTEAFINEAITPRNFAVGASKDYVDYAPIASLPESFDSAKALEYKTAAMEELTAAGATFPVQILMPYNPSTPNWDKECQIMEQQMEGLLGTDYIDIIVEAGPSTNFLAEVRRSGKYAMMICNWGADYADPQTWTDPFAYDGSYNFMYTNKDKFISEVAAVNKTEATQALYTEYESMVKAAKAITNDEAARYDAFATAEAYLIDHALVIPYCVKSDSNGYVASRLNPFEAQFAPYGLALQRFKYQTLHDPMGMDEFEAAYATWQEERTAALATAE